MHRAAPMRRALLQQRQVDEAIVILSKAVLPAVSSLAHVQRYARHDQP